MSQSEQQPRNPTPAEDGPAEARPAARRTVLEPGKTGTGEVGGPRGLEPTRYGDWEMKGRCIDF